jgi:hypothetical protein
MPKKASTASQRARAAARNGTKYTTAFRQHSAGKPSAPTRARTLANAWDGLGATIDFRHLIPHIDALSKMIPQILMPEPVDLAALMPKIDISALMPEPVDLAALIPKI